MSVNILDLEEAADLRVEDVRAYLERKGWTLKNYPPGTGQTWTDPAGKESFIMKDGWEWWMDSMVEAAVDFENRTPQAVLREMNPRMRKGIPSQEARDAHRLAWIGTSETGKNLMIGQWEGSEFKRGAQYAGSPWNWSFWPLDMQGNKVPWPRGADGREL